MSDLKQELIKVGEENPDLQPHLREVLAQMDDSPSDFTDFPGDITLKNLKRALEDLPGLSQYDLSLRKVREHDYKGNYAWAAAFVVRPEKTGSPLFEMMISLEYSGQVDLYEEEAARWELHLTDSKIIDEEGRLDEDLGFASIQKDPTSVQSLGPEEAKELVREAWRDFGKKDLKTASVRDQLIRLGSNHPDLQDHLEPVIDRIRSRSSSDAPRTPQRRSQRIDNAVDFNDDLFPTRDKFREVKQRFTDIVEEEIPSGCEQAGVDKTLSWGIWSSYEEMRDIESPEVSIGVVEDGGKYNVKLISAVDEWEGYEETFRGGNTIADIEDALKRALRASRDSLKKAARLNQRLGQVSGEIRREVQSVIHDLEDIRDRIDSSKIDRRDALSNCAVLLKRAFNLD